MRILQERMNGMKKGQVVGWFEGINHLCGVLLEDFNPEGTCIAATPLLFGAMDVEYVWRGAETTLVHFESKTPEVLQKYI